MKIIQEWLIEMFESFDLDEIIVNNKILLNYIPIIKKYESQINDSIIRLGGERIIKEGKSTAVRFKIPSYSIFQDETVINYDHYVGRGFKFYRKNIMKDNN